MADIRPLPDPRPLSDHEAHERLVRAREALGTNPGATVHADTALIAARQALGLLQYGLVAASERMSGRLPPVDEEQDPLK